MTTSKAKDVKLKCVLCDNNSGSHEHVFPAQLGGRRTSKKIYCHFHNQFLGKYVSVLNQQLSLFNSLIGVRPDRKKAKVESRQKGRDGRNYVFKDGEVKIIPPDLDERSDFEEGQEYSVSFSSDEDLEQWVKRQKTKGYDVSVIDRHNPVLKVHDQIPLQLNFGGVEFMKAVSYIGLSFYAQYFPDLVHSTNFKKLSDDILGDSNSQSSCQWDGREFNELLSEGSFNFSHTFIICCSSITGEVYVWVSFFSTLNFLVSLGRANDKPAEDLALRIDIDPLAEQAPNDLLKNSVKDVFYEITSLTESLQDMVSNNSGARRIQSLLKRIDAYSNSRSVKALLSDFEEGLPSAISKFFIFEEQRIYNLLTHADNLFFSEILEELSSIIPMGKSVKKTSFIERDEDKVLGLSDETYEILEKTKKIIKARVENCIHNKNEEEIKSLVYGDEGVRLIIKKVLLPLWMDKLSSI
jgi:hypothetical protein